MAMESISTASPATTALEREGPSSQDTSSKATKTTATSSSSNFFDDIGISTTSTLDSDTTTTTFTLIDEDGINGFYSRYKKDDTDTKETKLKKELEAAEAAIKALPESEQSLDPDKDIAVSIFNAKNVEAFGDKAKTQWLNGIRALTKNFNEQSVKRHAYIMSDEGSIWLQKVFSIASLRSEAQNDNLDIVQREAGRLIAGIVQNKMKSTNQKVDSVSLRHINDLFKADNDKAGIEAMLRLVRHIGLRSKSGVGQFAYHDRGFLNEVRNFFGGELGDLMSKSIHSKVNSLLSNRLSKESYDLIEDSSLVDEFKELKEEFITQVEEGIHKEFDKSSVKLTDEEREMLDARIKAYRDVYLAENDYNANIASEALIQNITDFEGQVNDIRALHDHAAEVKQDLKNAGREKHRRVIAIRRELIEDNAWAKAIWVDQLHKEAQRAIKVGDGSHIEVSKQNVLEKLEELRLKAKDSTGTTKSVRVPYLTSFKVLDEESVENLAKAIDAGETTFKNSSDKDVDVAGFETAIRTKLKDAAEAQFSAKLDHAKQVDKVIEDAGGAINIDALNVNDEATKTKIDTILNNLNLTTWEYESSGTTEGRAVTAKLAMHVAPLEAKLSSEVRTTENRFRKMQKLFNKVAITARSINFRLADVFKDAMVSDNGDMQDTYKKVFEGAMAKQFDQLKAELNASVGTEAEAKARAQYAAALQRVDNEHNIDIRGQKDAAKFLQTVFKKDDAHANAIEFTESLEQLLQDMNLRSGTFGLNKKELEAFTEAPSMTDPLARQMQVMKQKQAIFRVLGRIAIEKNSKENPNFVKYLKTLGFVNGAKDLPAENTITQFNTKLGTLIDEISKFEKEIEANQKVLNMVESSRDDLFAVLDTTEAQDSKLVQKLIERTKKLMATVFNSFTTAIGADDSYKTFLSNAASKTEDNVDAYTDYAKAVLLGTITPESA